MMRQSHNQLGFSLVEVIVAITLLLVVTVAATPLIINGLHFSTAQQRQQAAVIVTQEAMEQVRVRTAGLTSVAPLVAGRRGSDVTEQFTRLSGHAGVAQTNPASEPSAAVGSPSALLPITATVSRDGTVYTVETLIGTCIQQKVSGQLRCLKTGTGNAMVRAIVVTKWTAGETCTSTPAGYCSYETMSLVNLDTDLEWSDAS